MAGRPADCVERGADGDHLADPGRGGARQHVRQFGRGEVVQVAVGIDQHEGVTRTAGTWRLPALPLRA